MKKVLLLVAVLAFWMPSNGQYCTTNLYTSGCAAFADDLNDFTLGSFTDLATGCTGVNAYNDFTNKTIVVTQTFPQYLEVSSSYVSGESLKLFIDYNNDQDFDDPGEEVYVSPNTFGTTALMDTITFPAGSPVGTFRLRARVVFTSNPTYTACSSETYGEIHDYTIEIKPNVVGNCPAFSNFAIDSISATAAKVSWNPGAGNTGYFLEYGLAGFTPGTGTKITGTYPAADSVEILTGLTANTSYDLYFGELCNNGNDSVSFPVAQTFKTTKLCSPPTNFMVGTILATQVNLTWNYAGTATNFKVLSGPVGGTPGAGGTATASGSPYTLTGLASNTMYDIYLYANCGAANGVSDTLGPISILTPCAIFNAPYTQDFENSTVGHWDGVEDCWTFSSNNPGTTSNGGYSWEVRNTPQTTSGTGTGPDRDNTLAPATGGTFVTADVSGSVSGTDSTVLTSPPVDISGLSRPELTYFYHKHGTNMPDLRVDVFSNGVWNNGVQTVVGVTQTSPSDPYLPSFLDLSSYSDTIRVRFVVVSLGCCQGDVALDDISFDDAPACRELYALNLNVNNLTDTSVTISVDNSNTAFELEWGPCGFTQGTGTALSGTGAVSFSGLTGNTCYEYYVRKDCTADTNGFSVWTGPFRFFTNCSGFLAPYSNNFDNDTVNVVPTCWTTFITGGRSTAGVALTNQFGAPNSPPYHVRLYNGNAPNPTDSTLFISPRFDDLDSGNRRIDFRAKMSFGTGSLNIGTMSDPADPTTYNFIDSVALTAQHQLYIVDITAANGYNGTDNYVVFEHGNDGTFQTIYIDDFNYLEIPACEPPLITEIFVNTVTANTAAISWIPGDGDSTFVEWGLPGFTPGTVAQVGRGMATVGDSTFTITGLSPLTTYEFYLQDSCSANGYSPFVGPISFTTKCASPSAAVLPLFDGFENYTNGPTFQGNGNLCSSGHNWSFEGSGPEGRMRLQAADFSSTLFAQTGSQAVTLDHSPSASVLSSNYLIMTVNLTNYTTSPGIELGFSYLSHGQDLGTNDKVWVRGAPSDTWVEIYDLRANAPSSGQYYTVSNLDIVGAITGAGQSIGAQTQIRFSQEGRFSAGSLTFSDGYTFDDVSLTAVTCPTPTGLSAENVLDSTATLSWNTGAGLSSEIWFGPAGFYQGTTTTGGVRSVVNADSLVVDTLSGNTCYEFLVRTICQAGDSSVFAGPFTFCTECGAFTASYYNNFDVGQAVNEVPDCWEKFAVGGTLPVLTAFDVYTFGNPFSTPNHLRIYNRNADTLMGISPRFSDMDAGDKRLRFYINTSSFNSELVVGTLSDKSDPSSFSVLDTIPYQTGGYREVTVDITAANGYNGTDNYIGLLHGNTSTFQTIYVDEFRYERIPTCFRPNTLSVSNITLNGATVSWQKNAASTGNNFEVSYGLGLSNPANGTVVSATGTSATITGLNSSSVYCFYVRERCSATDSSFWEGPFCFNTPCVTVVAPFTEDFELFTVGHFDGSHNCWDFQSNNPSTTPSGVYSWEVRNSSQTTSGSSTGPDRDNTLFPAIGGKFITADVSGSSGTVPDSTLLTSPVIDITGLNSPELSYHLHRYGSVMADLYVDVYDGSAWVNGVHSYTNLSGIQTSQGAAWMDTVINLAPYSNITNFQVRFRSVSNGCCAGDNAIDDVSIYDASGSAPCPAPTNLTANVVSCDTVILSWSNGGDTSVVVYGDSTNLTAVNVLGDSSLVITGTLANTAYGAAVVNLCGSDTSAADTVTFNTGNTGAPTAVFTPAISGFSVSFDASASTGNGNSYSWDFGDGNTSTAQNPTNVYATGGSFTACLTVTNACGTDSVCQTLADVSLAENALSRGLSIFPNPTQGEVIVEFSLQENEAATLRVMDVRGKILMEAATAKGAEQTKLNLAKFTKGVYLIEVTSGDMKALRRIALQ